MQDEEALQNVTDADVETFVTVLPFYHVYGMMLTVVGVLGGAKLIILPKFEPTRFLETIQKYKVKIARSVE